MKSKKSVVYILLVCGILLMVLYMDIVSIYGEST